MTFQRNLFSLIFHSILFALNYHYLVNFSWLWAPKNPQTLTFGGQRKWLTYLNHEIQLVYCGVAVIIDIIALVTTKDWRKRHESGLHHFGDRLFFFCLTCSSVVGILFWGIVAYKVELLMPPGIENVYPWELNVYQHGFVAVNMWLELLLIPHYASKHPFLDLGLGLTFGLGYIGWMEMVYQETMKYPYPFLNTMELNHKLMFHGGSLLIMALVAALFRKLILLRWTHPHLAVPTTTSASKQKAQ
mmetsp:Transcript_19230/g.26921  ORF Transcript_19230/g.26921 Transcript_19230/m.26921 type:complete len:245 (+) Transcript_19230:37-771(+)